MIQHPIFNQKIVDLKSSLLARLANKFLSVGGASYYLFDEEYSTKILLFNYYGFFANNDFGTEWLVELYDSNGRRICVKSGVFEGQELAIIDLDDIKPRSPFGIVVCHIKPNNKGKILGKVFDTVFFTEHHRRDTVYHDVAHSLRWPTPIPYDYGIVGHAFSVVPDATPFLIIANSYQGSFLPKKIYCEPEIKLVNYRGESRQAKSSPIPPMGCRKINLFEIFPDGREHLGNTPSVIRVSGKNILRKPFFYQTDGRYFSSDHL